MAGDAISTSPSAWVPFAHLSRPELDRQLSPSRSARDAGGVLARHADATAALQTNDRLIVIPGLTYGERPRQRFDLVMPRRPGPHPCLIWFHGGFWQEGSKATSGYAASALVDAGWAVAGIGYTLTPDVRLRDVVEEATAAVLHLRRDAAGYGLDARRLVIGGHSAGAHLAATLLTGASGLSVTTAIAGALLVSGVYDLAPVAASYVNDLANIDDAEIRDLSPLRLTPACDVPVHLVIGADEPDAFVQQTEALALAWRPHLSRLTVDRASGRDHFDVLDLLAEPSSAAFAALVALAP